MFKQRCASCHFFHVDAKNLKQGHCSRFPPVPFALASPRGVAEMSMVPTVNRDYGCGEHRAGAALPVLGEASPLNGKDDAA